MVSRLFVNLEAIRHCPVTANKASRNWLPCTHSKDPKHPLTSILHSPSKRCHLSSFNLSNAHRGKFYHLCFYEIIELFSALWSTASSKLMYSVSKLKATFIEPISLCWFIDLKIPLLGQTQSHIICSKIGLCLDFQFRVTVIRELQPAASCHPIC